MGSCLIEAEFETDLTPRLVESELDRDGQDHFDRLAVQERRSVLPL
jgi:hypothetical protein